MISVNKLVRLIAAVGFCRAVFVGAICLLIVHIVTFEEFVILALFGFAIDVLPSCSFKVDRFRCSRNPDGYV
jgi:hypothetical protein